MKAEGHPDYHVINVVMSDGTKYQTRSVWGKEGDEMRLDIDPKNHPAWQGGAQKVIEKGQLKKFESRFGSFLSGGMGGDAKTEEKKEGKDKK
jgi:large subunit ribosomal protein L31